MREDNGAAHHLHQREKREEGESHGGSHGGGTCTAPCTIYESANQLGPEVWTFQLSTPPLTSPLLGTFLPGLDAVTAGAPQTHLSTSPPGRLNPKPYPPHTWSALRGFTARLATNSTVSSKLTRLRGRPERRSRSVPTSRAAEFACVRRKGE